MWLVALAIGCSHEAAPVVAPDDHPPLPEATPIGYLIDDATELHLRDDQLGKLRDLDQALAQQLDALDAGTQAPAPAAPRANPAGGGGRRGGGRHGGGGRRGGGAAPASHDPSSPAAIANAGPATLPTESAGSAAGSAAAPAARPSNTGERSADIQAALGKAFALLDPDQQPAARKVLADHGVTVEPASPPAGSGEP